METVPHLRLITWNCHHGSLKNQLRPLARLAPDIVFIQEWLPASAKAPADKPAGKPADQKFVARDVRPRKGVGLCAMNNRVALKEITHESLANHAAVAAEVSGPMEFIAAGLWARGPHYVDDVLRFLKSNSELFRSAPTVVMGDLNTGSKLGKGRRRTHRNGEVVSAFADLGMVSAYHAFHGCAHGEEPHATYRHLFRRRQPWHIDFCFIPESWRAAVTDVQVIDSRAWAKRSDHSPVQVDLSF